MTHRKKNKNFNSPEYSPPHVGQTNSNLRIDHHNRCQTAPYTFICIKKALKSPDAKHFYILKLRFNNML